MSMHKAHTAEPPLIAIEMRNASMQENLVMMSAFVHPPARTDCRGGGERLSKEGKGSPRHEPCLPLFQVLSEFDTSLYMHMLTISEHC